MTNRKTPVGQHIKDLIDLGIMPKTLPKVQPDLLPQPPQAVGVALAKLRAWHPRFGEVGTRDVDVAANVKVREEAIAAIEAMLTGKPVKRHRHEQSMWFIAGGNIMWCYQCGAWRSTHAQDKGKPWHKPSGIGGSNPAVVNFKG